MSPEMMNGIMVIVFASSIVGAILGWVKPKTKHAVLRSKS